MRVIFVSLYDEWCLGIRSLSATLKAEGHQVGIAYLHSLPEMHGSAGEGDPDGYHVPPASVPARDFSALLRLVAELQPDLIGLGYTSNFFGLAERVTALLRKATPARIIWGGVDVTANPDLAIASADIVCVGEGEGAMLDLTRRLAGGQTFTDVPNLWVREGEAIHRNDVRPLIQDLDALAWGDFEPRDKYWISGGRVHAGAIPTGSHLERNFPIMATRGCPYACTFCCNAMYRDLYGNKDYVRMRSVDNVLAEIERHLERQPGVRAIEFFDDVFGTRRDWVREFADKYPERVGLPFWCYTYPAFCKPELVADLKRAGVDFIVMGLQSGSQRTLQEDYHRNSPTRRVTEAAELIMGAGIPLILDLIGANPFETEADNLETLELLLALPPGFALQTVNPLTFYRNYPITDRAQREGVLTHLLQGRNAAVVEQSPAQRFWMAVHSLTQFHHKLGKDSIRAMARDSFLREHPEILESISDSLIEATYLPGTRIFRRAREEQMAHEIAALKGQVARFQGSRAVRFYFNLKRWLGLSTPSSSQPSAGTPRRGGNGRRPPSPADGNGHGAEAAAPRQKIQGATAFQC